MRYLLTYSLLNSFSWFHKLDNKEEEFKITLRREKIPITPPIQRGIEFEECIRNIMAGMQIDRCNAYQNTAYIIAKIVEGGTWQVKGYKDIQVNGIDFLLYGIADVINGPYIYDIKFISSKYEYGKYQDSVQHLIYLLLFPGMFGFKYLISDGNNVFIEDYLPQKENYLKGYISDFWSWLNANPEYMKLYQENWKAKEW